MPIQTILVPVFSRISKTAIRYAEMLSSAYQKPISLLCLNEALRKELHAWGHHVQHSSLPLKKAVAAVTKDQDSVMVVWENQSKYAAIHRCLLASRHLRIPYFFIPPAGKIAKPQRAVIPISFLPEEREKARWGRSLNRYFKSEFILLKPKDKGSQAEKNMVYIKDFFDKNNIPYRSVQGQRSSFKIDREALKCFSSEADLLLFTASRQYGPDDLFFGSRELHNIKRCRLPIMLLNPRNDLYILCGD